MAAAEAFVSSESFDASTLPAVGSTSMTIAGAGLTALPVEAIREHAPHVTSLDLTDNRISSFDGLELFTSLDTLVLDKNELASLEGMPKLATVKTLSFNNNNVEDMALFLDGVSASLPAIDFLSVMRNPASPPMIQLNDEDVAAATRHRLYVSYRLPRLGFLDAAPISAAERTEGASKGKFLVTRRAVASSVATTAAAPAAGATATSGTDDSASEKPKQMSAYLGIGRSTYDGKHSEGNRFIVNDDL